MFKKIVAIVGLTTSILSAQCNYGQHPIGVQNIAGTFGCNEVTRGPPMWSSLTQSPRIGFPMVWSWFMPPHLSNSCPTGIGLIALSTTIFPLGFPIPGTTTPCLAYVPWDILVAANIPMCNGCHSSLFLNVPYFPPLVGVSVYAQTYGYISTPNIQFFTGQPISVTFQQ